MMSNEEMEAREEERERRHQKSQLLKVWLEKLDIPSDMNLDGIDPMEAFKRGQQLGEIMKKMEKLTSFSDAHGDCVVLGEEYILCHKESAGWFCGDTGFTTEQGWKAEGWWKELDSGGKHRRLISDNWEEAWVFKGVEFSYDGFEEHWSRCWRIVKLTDSTKIQEFEQCVKNR